MLKEYTSKDLWYLHLCEVVEGGGVGSFCLSSHLKFTRDDSTSSSGECGRTGKYVGSKEQTSSSYDQRCNNVSGRIEFV